MPAVLVEASKTEPGRSEVEAEIRRRLTQDAEQVGKYRAKVSRLMSTLGLGGEESICLPPAGSQPGDAEGSRRAEETLADGATWRTFGHRFVTPSLDENRNCQPTIPTISVVGKFLESRKGSISEGSLISYKHTLSAFAKYCPVLPTEPEEVENYFARFKERRSAASAYPVIKLLYDFGSERYGISNVMRLVKRPRFKEKEPYSLSKDEARALLDACKDDRDLGLVHLYLGHGWRLEEACRANIGDIGEGQMLVRGKKRTEYMPLLPETREILLRLAQERNPGEPLFVSQHHKRLSHKQTYNVVKDVMTRAGVTKGKDPSQRIATHTLRKTFATLAVGAGCDSRIVARLLRHKKRDVTDLYIAMPMDILRQALERYSPLRLLNHQPENQELHKILSCSMSFTPFGLSR